MTILIGKQPLLHHWPLTIDQVEMHQSTFQFLPIEFDLIIKLLNCKIISR